MKFDAALSFQLLTDVPPLARAADLIGFDGLWTSETNIGPFLPLVLAAEHARRMQLGTAIAVGYSTKHITPFRMMLR